MTINRKKQSKVDPSFCPKIFCYQIIGRAAPSEKCPSPKIYRMRLFAKNVVMAKGKFWYFMKKINKVKQSRGEILGTNLLRERGGGIRVRNYAVWLRYDSRTGTHNMYKEYRDVTECGAVAQLYAEMAGNHRALSSCIQIIRIAPIEDKDCKRPRITQLHSPKLKFPAIRQIPMVPKHLKTTFQMSRPTTFQR